MAQLPLLKLVLPTFETPSKLMLENPRPATIFADFQCCTAPNSYTEASTITFKATELVQDSSFDDPYAFMMYRGKLETAPHTLICTFA